MPTSTAYRAQRAALQAQTSQLTACLSLHDLTRVIGQTVHAVQRERGATQWFLNGNEPAAIQALTAAITATHQVMPALDTRIDALLGMPPLPGAASLYQRLATALHALRDLDTTRKACRDRQQHSRDAFSAYSSLIQKLLAAVFETVGLWSAPEHASNVLALFSLMQAKEYAGQERALGMAGLLREQFSPDDQTRLNQLIRAQEHCLERADAFMAPADRDTLALSLNRLDLAALERVRRRILGGDDLRRKADSLGPAWFQIASARIDALLALENALQDNLYEDTQARLNVVLAHLERADSDPAAFALTPISEQGWRDRSGIYLLLSQEQADHLDRPDAQVVEDPMPRGVGDALMNLLHEKNRDLHQAQQAQAKAEALAREIRVLERAKTRLVQWYGWTEDQAHRELRRMAMNQGRKVIDIAGVLAELHDKPVIPSD
jgi:hypothetical protein